MIIICRWKDYYDIGRSFGYDPQDVRYVRTRTPIYEPSWSKWMELGPHTVPHRKNFQLAPAFTNTKNHVDIVPFRLLFCGKIYNGVQIVESVPLDDTVWDYILTNWYNYESFYQYLSKYHKLNWEYVDGHRWDTVKYSSFLDRVDTSDQLVQKCIKENVTILFSQPSHVNEGERLVLNRELKNLDFQKIMPPYQAYQEVDMWVSGVLPQPDRPMLTVSDKVKIHKRGFDKWSFRKQGKKK